MTLRFVPHHLIPSYEEKGWRVASRMVGSHHAQYSVIMERTLPRWFQYLPRFVRLLYLRRYNAPSRCSTS